MAMLMMVSVVTMNGQPIVKRETEKALLIEIEDGLTTWMPKSQIKGFFVTEIGVWLVTTPFMVKEKGLSYRSRAATESDIYQAQCNKTGDWL